MGFVATLLLVFTSASLMSFDGTDALCVEPYCPSPWRAFQGHCYLWVDTPMSWMDAERHCQMLSHLGKMVHLTSINSREEDEFISGYVGGSSWIGYNDYEKEGNFTWTDGSDASSYENWANGEPNDEGNNEDCVEKYPEQTWNDFICDQLKPFTCKM